MSTVMIQVRNVPQRIHRTLKARASLARKSLSDYVCEELVAMAAIPSEAEIRAQLDAAEPFEMRASAARIVRAERDAA